MEESNNRPAWEKSPEDNPSPGPSVPESPRHDALRGHLLDLYARVLGTATPTDQYLSAYFRRNKALARGARGFLAATLYALLRRRVRTLLLWGCRSGTPPERLADPGHLFASLSPRDEALAALARWLREDMALPPAHAEAVLARALHAAPPGDEGSPPWPPDLPDAVAQFTHWIGGVPAGENLSGILRAALEASVPPELLSRWRGQFGTERADALARELGAPAALDLRVSRTWKSREEAREFLAAQGIAANPTPFSPDGLRLERKRSLAAIEGLPPGALEVQDEASQLVSLALAPGDGWRVLDACAGGGGKTLHLAELVGEAGAVHANDIDMERMAGLRKRLGGNPLAARITILQPVEAEGAAPYDAILIDAPCLGLGRLRREPTLAWRGPLAERLAEVTALQRQCLHRYVPLLRSGGVLVYATCSIEPEETTAMIAETTAAFPDLQPDPLPETFQRETLLQIADQQHTSITLLPSTHGTDGFFIARLRRV